MIFLLLTIPLSGLCLYLAGLVWRHRARRQALALLLAGLLFLGLAVLSGLAVRFGWHLLQTLN